MAPGRPGADGVRYPLLPRCQLLASGPRLRPGLCVPALLLPPGKARGRGGRCNCPPFTNGGTEAQSHCAFCHQVACQDSGGREGGQGLCQGDRPEEGPGHREMLSLRLQVLPWEAGSPPVLSLSSQQFCSPWSFLPSQGGRSGGPRGRRPRPERAPPLPALPDAGRTENRRRSGGGRTGPPGDRERPGRRSPRCFAPARPRARGPSAHARGPRQRPPFRGDRRPPLLCFEKTHGRLEQPAGPMV